MKRTGESGRGNDIAGMTGQTEIEVENGFMIPRRGNRYVASYCSGTITYA